VSFLAPRTEGGVISSRPQNKNITTTGITPFTNETYSYYEEVDLRIAFIHEVLNVNSVHIIMEAKNMAKCPKCGKEVAPKKTWKMAGKPNKEGKRLELTIALSECCGKSFRTVVSKQKI
jgi:hypothetical protein